MKNCITINTKQDKVIVRVNEEATQSEILADLPKKLVDLKKLYQGDKTPILVTGKQFKNEEMDEIKEVMKEVLDVEIQFDTPRILGLHGIKKTFSKEIATSETKFHRGSLRSGQKIEFEGSLVILGDVNAGAEFLAGEYIIVLGILRGVAHAGAKGNKEAIIAAASIESAQVRIANIVKEIEKDELADEIKTCAYVNEKDSITIE